MNAECTVLTVQGFSVIMLQLHNIGARTIFSRGGQIRVLGRKSPSGIQGWNSGWCLGRSLQKLTTGCENNA